MVKRNRIVRELKGLEGDINLWKRLNNGYGRRSLAETFFSRFKLIFKERLSRKKMSHQILETFLEIHALNEMTKASYSN